MNKRLILRKVVITVMVVAIFLVVFSIQNGWTLTGADRYEAVAFAAVITLLLLLLIDKIIGKTRTKS
ncbi:hypothetical protein ISS21_02805 [Patescibacteria group bacterium]|nr:hypothetical protein [Patescibacteria group bacterium]